MRSPPLSLPLASLALSSGLRARWVGDHKRIFSFFVYFSFLARCAQSSRAHWPFILGAVAQNTGAQEREAQKKTK
jgi:hypothetical protein